MTLEEFCAAPRGTYGNALLNWTQRAPSDVVAYAVSYRNAAHNLVAYRERLGIGDIDQAACPILFLFRHAIELYMKALAYRVARLSIDDDELKEVLPRLWKEHSLIRLFEMAEPVLIAAGPKLPPALRRFDEEDYEFLSQLDRIDPGSYTFRYPVASTGNASLPGMLLVNIFVFARQADATLDFLSVVCRYLIEQIDVATPQMRLNLQPVSRKRRNDA